MIHFQIFDYLLITKQKENFRCMLQVSVLSIVNIVLLKHVFILIHFIRIFVVHFLASDYILYLK